MIAATTTAIAQTDQDLFLFSQNNLTGNARFTAMGGAFGALGANFGVASTNPAGLGFYTRHEVSMSLAVGVWNSETKYKDKTRSAFEYSFQIPDAHYVFSTHDARFQFGVGVNRLNDFNTRTSIEGNSNSSFTNRIAENANGIPLNSLGGLEALAYDGILIEQNGSPEAAPNTYFANLQDAEMNQRQTTKTNGNLTELAFTFSGNIDEKFYYGVTLGVPILDYSEESTLKENVRSADDFVIDTLGFTDFTYAHDYDVNGTGINLKIGVVYKPINSVRIGLAFHTPTVFSIRQKFKRELEVNMRNVEYREYGWEGSGGFYGSQDLDFKYKFFTPAKGILSLGFVIGTYGVIGIEGELLSYRSIKMLSDDGIADIANEEIKNKYQKISGVVKFGTEWRVSVVSLRAGYNYRSNPYIDKKDNLWSSHLVTGGVGVRLNKSLSFDLGVMYVFNPETYYPYYLDNAKTSILPDKVNTNKMLYTLTFNARF
jgi:long-subunit fatty acid transport protein